MASYAKAQEASDDFVLRKISKDVSDTPGKIEKIVLKIEKPNGEPVAQEEVAFTLISSSLKLLDGPEKVVTDANGIAKYETRGLARGKYFVLAEVQGRKVKFSIDIRFFSFGFIESIWPQMLILVALIIAVCLVYLKIKSTNIVIDEETGRGIQGVFIEVYDDIGKIVVNTVTDASGRFRAGLEKGEYLLKVSKGGYAFQSVEGHGEASEMGLGARLVIQKKGNIKILMQSGE